MKNNSGFSLVELIVVIAIMAILAGVAVPTYSKYITKAKDAKVTAQLDEAKTAAFAVAAENSTTVSSIEVKTTTTGSGASAVTTVMVNGSLDASDYFDTVIVFDNTNFPNGARWSNETWTAIE